jgi:hypothetical protein
MNEKYCNRYDGNVAPAGRRRDKRLSPQPRASIVDQAEEASSGTLRPCDLLSLFPARCHPVIESLHRIARNTVRLRSYKFSLFLSLLIHTLPPPCIRDASHHACRPWAPQT